ncbi:MAG: phosphoserine phosphatase SerB [Pseudomonadota bacterium]
MFVAVMIARPDGPPLDTTTFGALRDAWGGTEARWLAPQAAEFKVPSLPDRRWEVWTDLQVRGLDLCIVPAEGRRKRLLLADMDSTMIAQECIDELAEEAGVGARVRTITARAMNGELDFEAALEARVALLDGLDAAVMDRVFRDRITFASGGMSAVATMRAHGARAELVSGGFTAFTEKVAAALGFDGHRANVLEVCNGKLTGTVARPILGRDAKVSTLEALVAEMGIGDADVLAVGDGANDLGMLHRAGMGVALHAKPAVAEAVDLRITHGDLTALLWLQGYTADDVVTA